MLPGAFPNLLANGASGIAVGMATSIPPHNAAELCDAALASHQDPNATVEKLVQFVPGPDFPTGGIIIDDRADDPRGLQDRPGLASACARAGRQEDLGRGAWQIVVTEIPYQVQKGRLIEKHGRTARPRRSCRCSAICAMNSAEDVRLVLEPKSRTVDPQLLME